ncbi:MAG: hypothetical protein K2H22_09445, partial [Muribaculaceae bacterium]|nr:hypothetical protein [Muribaculaceae bacterium]
MEQNTDKEHQAGKGHMGASVLYIVIVGIAFAILTAVFVFFPRTEYSELEKRDLAEFPDISDVESIRKDPGKFTAAVSSWFSDTEPYRDELMTLSMGIRGAMKGDFRSEEETVSFRPADAANPAAEASDDSDNGKQEQPAAQEDNAEKADDTATEDNNDDEDLNDGKAKLASSGTIIV